MLTLIGMLVGYSFGGLVGALIMGLVIEVLV